MNPIHNNLYVNKYELTLDNNQLLNFVDKNIKTDTFLQNIYN